jgi:hypothetical protein
MVYLVIYSILKLHNKKHAEMIHPANTQKKQTRSVVCIISPGLYTNIYTTSKVNYLHFVHDNEPPVERKEYYLYGTLIAISPYQEFYF